MLDITFGQALRSLHTQTQCQDITHILLSYQERKNEK